MTSNVLSELVYACHKADRHDRVTQELLIESYRGTTNADADHEQVSGLLALALNEQLPTDLREQLRSHPSTLVRGAAWAHGDADPFDLAHQLSHGHDDVRRGVWDRADMTDAIANVEWSRDVLAFATSNASTGSLQLLRELFRQALDADPNREVIADEYFGSGSPVEIRAWAAAQPATPLNWRFSLLCQYHDWGGAREDQYVELMAGVLRDVAKAKDVTFLPSEGVDHLPTRLDKRLGEAMIECYEALAKVDPAFQVGLAYSRSLITPMTDEMKIAWFDEAFPNSAEKNDDPAGVWTQLPEHARTLPRAVKLLTWLEENYYGYDMRHDPYRAVVEALDEHLAAAAPLVLAALRAEEPEQPLVCWMRADWGLYRSEVRHVNIDTLRYILESHGLTEAEKADLLADYLATPSAWAEAAALALLLLHTGNIDDIIATVPLRHLPVVMNHESVTQAIAAELARGAEVAGSARTLTRVLNTVAAGNTSLRDAVDLVDVLALDVAV